MIENIALLIFFIILFGLVRKKEILHGKYLPKILAIDKVLMWYFIIAMLFALFYCLVDVYLQSIGNKCLLTIGSGHPFDYIYFSLTTQLTIGYGDITPKYAVVRLLTIVQGMLGVVLIGGIIASIVQFSSMLKVKSIIIFKVKNIENHYELIFQLKLDYNPKTVYEDLHAKIFFNNKNNEVIIARTVINKSKKSQEIIISCLYTDMNQGIIWTKDNKIYYEAVVSYGEFGEEIAEICLEIEELFIELSYSTGNNGYTNKLKIPQLENLVKLFEGKTKKVFIDSKSFVVLQSY